MEDDMAGINKKRILIVTALAVAICITGVLTYCSQTGRAVLGISTVVVANDSNEDLTDVRVALSTAQPTAIIKSFPRIPKGTRKFIRIRTSDLVVDSMDFILNGNKMRYTESGLACPGEELLLSIGASGKVNAHYTP